MHKINKRAFSRSVPDAVVEVRACLCVQWILCPCLCVACDWLCACVCGYIAHASTAHTGF